MNKKFKDFIIVFVIIPLSLSSLIWVHFLTNYMDWKHIKEEYHTQEGYWEFFGRNWYKKGFQIEVEYLREYKEKQEKAAE
ncbi:hypothetical protein [Paenibacillus polymyxa]|uniref:hypothetical protein n=1 Tax=Paenibacillus polymyxa TaxID=1406 RepID=UPI0007EC18F6|nr:hypothetical protein [Paenibacillus polymyxa]OAZ49746.1 hypothetical protein A9Z39_10590 [Paenibacillus polymyxa]